MPLIRAIVFTRSPVLGAVKTRLAAAVGDAEALEVHTALLIRTVEAVRRAAVDRPDLVLEIHHLGPADALFACGDLAAPLVVQRGDTLAANLEAVLRDPCAGGCGGSLVIGSDHPTLEPAHILAMADILDRHPVCVGPAEDGGFWSVGATVPLPGIMAGGFLETASALDGLRAALTGAGLTWGEGPTLWDVDTLSDLERWRALGPRRIS